MVAKVTGDSCRDNGIRSADEDTTHYYQNWREGGREGEGREGGREGVTYEGGRRECLTH